MSGDIDKLGISYEEAWRRQEERRTADLAVSGYSQLGRGPEVITAYQRLLQAEQQWVTNGDYSAGCAETDDDLIVLRGLNNVLLTAEHATNQKRRMHPLLPKKTKVADYGTGGLAAVVAEDTDSPAIIAVGRQTSDANYYPRHPLKEAMTRMIMLTANRAHLSLHLLDRGRSTYPRDSKGFSLMLGIGDNPSEATLALKEMLREIARDLDLNVGINEPHLTFDKKHQLNTKKGVPRRQTFKGVAKGNATRAHAQMVAEAIGKQDYAAVQVEINEVFLVRQDEGLPYPKEEDKELGPYIGQLFTRLAVEAVAKL